MTPSRASFMIGSGLVLSLIVMASLDQWVAEWVAAGRTQMISLFALSTCGVTIAIMMTAADCGRRVRSRAQLTGAGIARTIFVAVSTIGGIVASWPIKQVVGRARPSSVGPSEPFHFDILSSDVLAFWTNTAFPSAQAAMAGGLSMALALLHPRWRPAFFSAALAVSLSRVLMEAHWLSDVIAGFALGAGMAIVIAGAFVARKWLDSDRNAS